MANRKDNSGAPNTDENVQNPPADEPKAKPAKAEESGDGRVAFIKDGVTILRNASERENLENAGWVVK